MSVIRTHIEVKTLQAKKVKWTNIPALRVENKKTASFNSQACKTDSCKLCPEQYISYLLKVTHETSGRLSKKAQLDITWSLKESWSILVPFIKLSASYHLGRGMEWVGFTESLFSGEGSTRNVHWRSEDNP